MTRSLWYGSLKPVLITACAKVPVYCEEQRGERISRTGRETEGRREEQKSDWGEQERTDRKKDKRGTRKTGRGEYEEVGREERETGGRVVRTNWKGWGEMEKSDEHIKEWWRRIGMDRMEKSGERECRTTYTSRNHKMEQLKRSKKKKNYFRYCNDIQCICDASTWKIVEKVSWSSCFEEEICIRFPSHWNTPKMWRTSKHRRRIFQRQLFFCTKIERGYLDGRKKTLKMAAETVHYDNTFINSSFRRSNIIRKKNIGMKTYQKRLSLL